MVAALVEQRRDSIEQFEAAGRIDWPKGARRDRRAAQDQPPAASDDDIAAAAHMAIAATVGPC